MVKHKQKKHYGKAEAWASLRRAVTREGGVFCFGNKLRRCTQPCAGRIHLSKDHRNLPSRGLSCPAAVRDPPVTTATPVSLQRWHCGRDKYM